MSRYALRSLVLMALMCAAALGAYAIKPTKLLADQLPPIDLDAMVPKQFGEWRAIDKGSIQVVNPQAETLVNDLYQDVLNRVYVNQDGYAVMLSIAYGRDQSGLLQVHRPEICYPAQGFQVKKSSVTEIASNHIVFSGTSLLTQAGARVEPILYWTTIGERTYMGQLEKKSIAIRYALLGLVPDGMVVRISSIDSNQMRSNDIHKSFAKDMLNNIPSGYIRRFVGELSPKI